MKEKKRIIHFSLNVWTGWSVFKAKMTIIDPFDLESVQLCLQGQRDSYEPLVKKYNTNVLALAMNLLGNYDDALDVMPETFVQAYVNLECFDCERSVKTWVLSIAVKRCMDLFRKQKRFLQYFNHHANQFRNQREQTCDNNTLLEESPLFFPLLKRLHHPLFPIRRLRSKRGCSR